MTTPASLRKALPTTHVSSDDGDSSIGELERQELLQMDIPYIAQSVGTAVDEEASLPVRSIEAFLKQEAVIIDALRTGSE